MVAESKIKHLHLQNLSSNEEADTHWSQVDDPSGHLYLVQFLHLVLLLQLLLLHLLLLHLLFLTFIMTILMDSKNLSRGRPSSPH